MMNLLQSNQSEFAWWVEVNTTVPRCTYYFGPFDIAIISLMKYSSSSE
ncbi:MAG: DUF1816 domain-containing protein [Nostoc sp.]